MKTRMEWLQGTARLAGDGLVGAVHTVEGMHLAIVDSISRFVPFGSVVSRVTGFTYARVRDVAQVTRRTTDGALALLERNTSRERARELQIEMARVVVVGPRRAHRVHRAS
jgi:hypothetical protein